MAYKIIVSKTFLKNVSTVYHYLREEWSKKIGDYFIEILQKQVHGISTKPGIGSPAKTPNVRKLLITPHNKLYYRINDNHTIVLLTLFDTRKHPNKNRYE